MGTERTRLAADPSMPQPGDRIAERYTVETPIGEGGFAAVFRATDTRTGQTVAVKVLDPYMSRRPEFAARFEREVATVSRLRHHNTIKVMDTGRTESGCLFLVMELLDGVPLDDLLASDGALSERRVHRIAVQVLKSLAEAHGVGIVHRDLKPANLFVVRMVGESDYIKVLDFGIAKSMDDSAQASLTQTGELLCSPHYVAPERMQGKGGPESDLYSLGVLLVELLIGRPPYEGDTPMAIMLQHAGAEPVPIPLVLQRGAMGGVLLRATAKSVDERYRTALEMLEDLTAIDPATLRDTSLAVEERTRDLPGLSVPSTLSFRRADGLGPNTGVTEIGGTTSSHAKGSRIAAAIVALVVAGAGWLVYSLVTASGESTTDDAATPSVAMQAPPSSDEAPSNEAPTSDETLTAHVDAPVASGATTDDAVARGTNVGAAVPLAARATATLRSAARAERDARAAAAAAEVARDAEPSSRRRGDSRATDEEAEATQRTPRATPTADEPSAPAAGRSATPSDQAAPSEGTDTQRRIRPVAPR